MAQDFAKKKSPAAKPKPKPRASTPPAKATKRKSNSRKTSKPTKKAPFWAWILVGIALMGFAFFLTQISNTDSNKAKTALKKAVKTAPKEEKTSQVRFDFYEILKGHEVEVDDKVIINTPKKSNTISWLQVASFKQAQDADQLRAKLLLLNLNSSVETTQNKQSQTWHRVMVGPFKSRSKLAKARSVLASNKLNGIVIKRKPSP